MNDVVRAFQELLEREGHAWKRALHQEPMLADFWLPAQRLGIELWPDRLVGYYMVKGFQNLMREEAFELTLADPGCLEELLRRIASFENPTPFGRFNFADPIWEEES